MQQAKILLLDCHPEIGVGSMLQKMLTAPSSLSVQLRLDPVVVSLPALDHEKSTRIFVLHNPDVVLLILPPQHLQPCCIWLQALPKELLSTPILVVTETGEPHDILALLKLGVADFITPPLQATTMLLRIWRLLEQTLQGARLTQRLKERLGLQRLIGESPAFLAVLEKIPLIAKCDAGVLISGETGTGKEMCARAMHYLSRRTRKPFVPVNCGAIPVELVENELFGHERGAFTSATTSQPGLIQEADGGTLFLDEIDSLSLAAQVKLLRFLQEKEFRPLGSTRVHTADVRVIAATNTDVEKAVRDGQLRQDLYYRLNVIPLVLPALRERRQDIPLLVRHFLAKYAAEFNKPVPHCSAEALQALMLYDWPGNVRELEHMVQRAVALSRQEMIRIDDIFLPGTTTPPASFQAAKAQVVTQFERAYIQGLLHTYDGNITRAAQAARKNRRAFWQLMQKHRIDAQSFRLSTL
jgi:DNA-binding NtrC family response regulator